MVPKWLKWRKVPGKSTGPKWLKSDTFQNMAAMALENPRTAWRFRARKIAYFLWSIFQQAMFDYCRVGPSAIEAESQSQGTQGGEVSETNRNGDTRYVMIEYSRTSIIEDLLLLIFMENGNIMKYHENSWNITKKSPMKIESLPTCWVWRGITWHRQGTCGLESCGMPPWMMWFAFPDADLFYSFLFDVSVNNIYLFL